MSMATKSGDAFMATEKPVLPGDIIQGAAGDWRDKCFFLVCSVHSWGVGAHLNSGPDQSVYYRFLRGRFVVVGAAFLLPPDLAAARKQAIKTLKEDKG
jgi:hypothetical protein